MANVIGNFLSRAFSGFSKRSVNSEEVKKLFNVTLYNAAYNWYSGILETDANPQSIITVPAVAACVNRITGTIGSSPLCIYKRDSKGVKTVDSEHPFFYALHDAPNELMSAYDFWYSILSNYLLRGFAFADVIYNEWGVPFIYPLDARYHVTMQENGVVYHDIYLMSGRQIKRYESEVLHFRNHTRDGINNYDPIAMLKSTIMMALSMRVHGVSFFQNYANPSLIITHPQKVGEAGKKNLADSLTKKHEGAFNSGRTIVLEEGATANKLQDSMLSSQFEELVRFVNGEIARFFGVPPHKIAILDNATYNNIEAENSGYLKDCILPIATRLEMEINRKLLHDPLAKEKSFCKFDLDEANRADMKTRYASYGIAIANRILSPNEVRQKENLNPVEGLDTYENPNTTAGGLKQEPDGDEPVEDKKEKDV